MPRRKFSGSDWPEQFGQRVKRLREQAKLSQGDLARLAGMVSASAIVQVEKGQTQSVNLGLLEALVRLMRDQGLDPGWLFTADQADAQALLSAVRTLLRGLHAERDLDQAAATDRVADLVEPGFTVLDAEQLPPDWRGRYVPIIGRLAAGEGVDTLEAEGHPPGWAWRFLRYNDAPAAAFALRVEGDSMSPQYLDGDMVIVDGATRVVSGTCCTITSQDGDRVARLKRLVVRGRIAELRSLNRDYETICVQASSVEAYAIWKHLPLRRKVCV